MFNTKHALWITDCITIAFKNEKFITIISNLSKYTTFYELVLKLYNNYGKLLYLIVRYYRKLNFTKHALVFEACA